MTNAATRFSRVSDSKGILENTRLRQSSGVVQGEELDAEGSSCDEREMRVADLRDDARADDDTGITAIL